MKSIASFDAQINKNSQYQTVEMDSLEGEFNNL